MEACSHHVVCEYLILARSKDLFSFRAVPGLGYIHLIHYGLLDLACFCKHQHGRHILILFLVMNAVSLCHEACTRIVTGEAVNIAQMLIQDAYHKVLVRHIAGLFHKQMDNEDRTCRNGVLFKILVKYFLFVIIVISHKIILQLPNFDRLIKDLYTILTGNDSDLARHYTPAFIFRLAVK